MAKDTSFTIDEIMGLLKEASDSSQDGKLTFDEIMSVLSRVHNIRQAKKFRDGLQRDAFGRPVTKVV